MFLQSQSTIREPRGHVGEAWDGPKTIIFLLFSCVFTFLAALSSKCRACPKTHTNPGVSGTRKGTNKPPRQLRSGAPGGQGRFILQLFCGIFGCFASVSPKVLRLRGNIRNNTWSCTPKDHVCENGGFKLGLSVAQRLSFSCSFLTFFFFGGLVLKVPRLCKKHTHIQMCLAPAEARTSRRGSLGAASQAAKTGSFYSFFVVFLGALRAYLPKCLDCAGIQ